MKTTKDGKLKLSKDERQVGSFVYKDEPEHVKIMDINSSMSVRLPKAAFMSGRLLDMQLKRKETVFLHNYAAMCYNLLGVLPDENGLYKSRVFCEPENCVTFCYMKRTGL